MASLHPVVYMALVSMLVLATWVDVRSHRIPNVVSYAGAGVACLAALFWGGLEGIGWSFAGMTVGLLAFLPWYALGVMGAGDVKLMAAVGAFLGPYQALFAIVLTLIAGGFYGVIVVLHRDGLRETVLRYAFGAKHLVLGGVWLPYAAPGSHRASLRIPYAAAIGTGTLAAVGLMPLWVSSS